MTLTIHMAVAVLAEMHPEMLLVLLFGYLHLLNIHLDLFLFAEMTGSWSSQNGFGSLPPPRSASWLA